ncbi:MAG: CpsB/CapC family capsule biosynthesis tyrosine phosphatase [bacterium]
MIDIHSHVLPFIDDGSPDMESSLALLREAELQGVKDLFLTPHYYPARGYFSTRSENQEVYANLKKACSEAGIGITMHLGNEIYYSIETIRDLREKIVAPMGNSKMVLLEFSMNKEEEDITEAIHNIRAIGYQPIIAHPERYPYLDKSHDFEVIRKMGGLIQLNAASIVGKYGGAIQKTAFSLLKLGWIDFIASDIHSFRKNQIREAYELVARKIDPETAERVFNNRTILA